MEGDERVWCEGMELRLASCCGVFVWGGDDGGGSGYVGMGGDV